jgi:carbohydrate-selective porin OprB
VVSDEFGTVPESWVAELGAQPKKQRNRYVHPRVVYRQDVIDGSLDLQRGRLTVDEYSGYYHRDGLQVAIEEGEGPPSLFRDIRKTLWCSSR